MFELLWITFRRNWEKVQAAKIHEAALVRFDKKHRKELLVEWKKYLYAVFTNNIPFLISMIAFAVSYGALLVVSLQRQNTGIQIWAMLAAALSGIALFHMFPSQVELMYQYIKVTNRDMQREIEKREEETVLILEQTLNELNIQWDEIAVWIQKEIILYEQKKGRGILFFTRWWKIFYPVVPLLVTVGCQTLPILAGNYLTERDIIIVMQAACQLVAIYFLIALIIVTWQYIQAEKQPNKEQQSYLTLKEAIRYYPCWVKNKDNRLIREDRFNEQPH